MKPDSMLVEPAHILNARQAVAAKGGAEALGEFGQAEPALATFIGESLAAVAGKMSLSGAPTEVVQGVYEEVLVVLVTSVQAMKRGHYELWKDTATGTRLAQLDPTLQPKPRQRRKKRQGDGPEEEAAA
jgi:hypothetical protein